MFVLSLCPTNLSSQTVCSRFLLSQRIQPFQVVGLRYCGIDVSKPATYSITFTVSFNGGAESTTQRTVVVEANCPSGEVSTGHFIGGTLSLDMEGRASCVQVRMAWQADGTIVETA